MDAGVTDSYMGFSIGDVVKLNPDNKNIIKMFSNPDTWRGTITKIDQNFTFPIIVAPHQNGNHFGFAPHELVNCGSMQPMRLDVDLLDALYEGGE